jgi:hypothetical protein
VFGMTIFAGAFGIALVPLLNRLRAMFRPEYRTGRIHHRLFRWDRGIARTVCKHAATVFTGEWIVGAFTLGTMIALNVWAKDRPACSAIGPSLTSDEVRV